MNETPFRCGLCGMQCDFVRRNDHDCGFPKIFQQVLSLRASGHVRRWHTIRVIGEQTAAEHSGAAVSLMLLLHPSPSIALLKAMSWHDSSERVVGDVPAPIRRKMPEFAAMYEQMERVVAMDQHPIAIVELTDEEQTWLRAIDVLELLMFASEQVRIGNADFEIVYGRALSCLDRSQETPLRVRSFASWYSQHGRWENFA